MSKVWFGSLENRIEENKMFCKEIEVGTGLTEYLYSDCHPYEVVKVVNQKHVFVRGLDHVKAPNSSAYDNDWTLISNPDKPIHELKFRYGKWHWVHHYTKESLNRCILIPKNIYDKLQKQDEAIAYEKSNISFGIAKYYYDYTL